jgi:hypothetical protein
MKLLGLAGIFIGGVVVGCITMGLWSGHVFSRLTVSKEAETAFLAAQQAEWLAELRLGETTNVIKDMEKTMDLGVVAISRWQAVSPPDDKTRKSRDAFLTSVKVYHKSYPPTSDTAASIEPLLASVPGRSPLSTCRSGVCRLDDLRLANLPKATNSPGSNSR